MILTLTKQGWKAKRSIYAKYNHLPKLISKVESSRFLRTLTQSNSFYRKMKHWEKRSSGTKDTLTNDYQSSPKSRRRLSNIKLSLNSRWPLLPKRRSSMKSMKTAQRAPKLSLMISGSKSFMTQGQKQKNSKRLWTAPLQSRILFRKVLRELTRPSPKSNDTRVHYYLTLKRLVGYRTRLTVSEMRLVAQL